MRVHPVFLAGLLPTGALWAELLNPGFERGFEGWQVAWNPAAIEEAAAHGGRKCVLLDLTGAMRRPDKPAQVSQVVRIDQREPAPVRVGGWAKTHGVDLAEEGSYCRIRVLVGFQDGSVRANADHRRQSMNLTFSGTSDWQYRERTLVFDKPVRSVTFLLQGFRCAGKVWFDDMALETLGSAPGGTPGSLLEPCRLDVAPDRVTLENKFLRAVVSLQGGRIISLVDKRNGRDYTSSAKTNGIGKDALSEISMRSFWGESYSLKGQEASPDLASVTLVGESGAMPYFRFEKAFTLRRDSSSLTMDMTLVNTPEAMVERYFSFRHHNGIRTPGEKMLCLVPTSQGVSATEQGSVADVYHRDVVAGWAAAVGKESGSGLLFTVDYGALDFFYNWFGQETTLEYFFKTVKVGEGREWSTRIGIMPLSKMSAINGAVLGLAAGFVGLAGKHAEARPARLNLQVASDTARRVQLEIRAEVLPSRRERVVRKTTALLSPAGTLSLPVEWAKPAPGTNVLHCDIRDAKGEKLLLRVSQVVAFGTSTGQHVFKPEREKIPTVEGVFPLELSEDFVTPHVKWAKPLPDGKIRVLGIVSTFNCRELVELAQRLDMDFSVAGFGPCARYFNRYTTKHSNAWLRRLLEEDYDLIIIDGLNWKKLVDPGNRKAVIEKVKRNTSLLYTFPTNLTPAMAEILPLKSPKGRYPATGDVKVNGTHYITTGVPLGALPPFWTFAWQAEEPLLSCGDWPLLAGRQLAKSRVVAFGYPVGIPGRLDVDWWQHGGLTPTPPTIAQRDDENLNYPYWEYYYLLLARAARWAVSREPKSMIEAIEAEPGRATVTLGHRGPAITAQLEWELRNGSYRSLGKGVSKLKIEPGRRQVELVLPGPRAGTGLLHLRLLGEERVLDGAAVRITAPFPVRITRIDGAFTQNGSKAQLAGTVDVSGNCALELSLLDVDDREVAAATVPGEPGQIDFGLTFEDPIYRAYRLLVTPVVDGLTGDTLAKELFLPLPRRRYDDYTVISWLHDYRYLHKPFYLEDLLYRRLREFGFREFAMLTSGGAWSHLPTAARFLWRHGANVAVNNVSPLHLKKKYFDDNRRAYQRTGSRECLHRQPCLDDPKYLQATRERVDRITGVLDHFKPSRYTFGDENSITMWGQPFDFCFHEATLRKLRAAMRKTFGNIEKLNRVWDRNLASFDEVVPDTTDQAKASGNYASWLEHRRQMERSVVEFYRYVRDCLRQKDPGALIAVSGTQNPSAYTGFDWYQVMEVFKTESMLPYGGIQTELLSSFASPDFRCYPWGAGYSGFGPKLNYRIWEAAFHYRGSGCSFYEDRTATNPDMTTSRQGAAMLKATVDLRRGLGKLLLGTEPLHDGIAIAFSPDSLKIATITEQRAKFDNSVVGWRDLLAWAGYTFRFVDPAQFGGLADLGIRALILPYTLVLSRTEVNRLRSFVAAGGWIIADAGAGAFDGHGRPSGYAAESLFGVRAGGGDLLPGELEYGTLSLRVTVADAKVAQAGASALGSVGRSSALFRRKIGKGGVFYLNFLLDQYPMAKLSRPENLRYQALLASLLEQCGVEHALAEIQQAERSLARSHRLFAFRQGPARYLGIIREPQAPAEDSRLTVKLARKFHVYDARRQEYLGNVDRYTCELVPAEAALFALLPAKIDRVQLRIERKAVRPGGKQHYLVQTDPRPVFSSVVCVEVYAPDDRLLRIHSTNIAAPNGIASGAFRTALNAQPGTWRVRAVGAVSGKSAESSFVLRGR